ncbi:MAG: hypothetical protein D3916_14325 [Candidatus Electrothrix sp. MAN1_4]|nr:hypothetical protein [Candidatus Electrothrix sp. MAN1_4]
MGRGSYLLGTNLQGLGYTMGDAVLLLILGHMMIAGKMDINVDTKWTFGIFLQHTARFFSFYRPLTEMEHPVNVWLLFQCIRVVPNLVQRVMVASSSFGKAMVLLALPWSRSLYIAAREAEWITAE